MITAGGPGPVPATTAGRIAGLDPDQPFCAATVAGCRFGRALVRLPGTASTGSWLGCRLRQSSNHFELVSIITAPRRKRIATHVAPLALSASLIASGLITSRKKAVWADEVFSATFIGDSSIHRALHNLAAPADGAQPLYYSLGWLWAHVIGPSDTSLRMLSAACVVAGVWLLWATLRVAFPPLVAATGLLLATATSELFVYHVSEIRFYGLLIGLVAAALYTYVRIALNPKPTRSELFLQAAVSSALVYCHLIGWIYSGVLLAAHVLIDYGQRRFRPRVYASVVVGWATFIVWMPAFIRQIGLTKPHSNLRAPTLTELLTMYQFDARALPLLFIALVALVALTRSQTGIAREGGFAADPSNLDWRWDSSRAAVFVGGVAVLTVPLITFVVSRLVTPMLLPRYVVPSVLGIAVVLAEIVGWAGVSRTPRSPAGRFAWLLFLSAVTAYPVARAWGAPPTPVPGRAELLRLVPPGIPIVVDESYYYHPLNYRNAMENHRVYYLLDWESAIDPANNGTVAVMDRLLSEWVRAGYAKNVVPVPEFVCTHDQWVMLHTPGFLMFERAVARDSAFTLQTLGYAEQHPIILVSRRPGISPRVCDSRNTVQWLPPTGPGSHR